MKSANDSCQVSLYPIYLITTDFLGELDKFCESLEAAWLLGLRGVEYLSISDLSSLSNFDIDFQPKKISKSYIEQQYKS